MEIIEKQTPLQQIIDLQDNYFGDMVKAVVDVKKEILAVDAELHADLEKQLLESGSRQSDLWEINLYPGLSGDDFIEFDSMINIRPYQNNPSWDVLDQVVRERIISVVQKLIV